MRTKTLSAIIPQCWKNKQIIDGMVYELYFPVLLKKHSREIIKHLGELPEFTENISDAEKMKICKDVVFSEIM